jgi:mannosyltransferase
MAQRHGENALAHVHEAFPLEKEADAISAVYERVFNS